MTTSDSISVSTNQDGLSFINVDNAHATAKVSLFGAHVMSYCPKSDGKERLWVSPHAYLNGEKPIRGGIPLCWPWFGHNHGQEKGTLPSHGFLRTQTWSIANSKDTSEGTELTLLPAFTKAKGFDHKCEVKLIIMIGESLSVSLITTNTDDHEFSIDCALHTYFNVEHISKTTIDGITGDYEDKTRESAVLTTPTPYSVSEETDRIHFCKAPNITIVEDGVRTTEVTSSGNDTIVVWNPWRGAASLSDMDAFGYKHMLCVETTVTQGYGLQPNETHVLTQVISTAK